MFLKKHNKEILLFVLLSLSYFIVRLSNIMYLPIFTDEAIYMRWAQIALRDSSWRFISLTDGKQPLFIWAAMVAMKVIHDPLFAGRLISVFSGFFTLLGLWFLTFELFRSKKIAFLSSFLYIFYPFAQVYDRMALMDGMVGTFAVWALYFSILLVRRIRLDIAYTLGFVIGAGTLTKTSDFFSIYLLPFTLVLFDFRKNHLKKRIILWVMLAAFSVVISQVLYNILRLSPLFEMINAKDANFVYPFSKWVHHPFTFFVGNFTGLSHWLWEYLKLPYAFLIVGSLIFWRKFTKEKLLLVLYFLLPFTALALFGRILFPRFIYFMSLSLLPLAAWFLWFIIERANNFVRGYKNKFIGVFINIAVVFVFISYSALVSFQFALGPVNASIPPSDSKQYINNWSAGWGVRESVDFFKKQAQNSKIFVATEGTFGLMPESMELYLIQNKNIIIKGFWPIGDTLPKEALSYAKKMPSYFIFYQPEHQTIPAGFPLKLVFKVREGNSNYYYRVYQILPQK